MSERTGLIYRWTNSENGLMYIGKTIRSLNTRISEHWKAALQNEDNEHFHNALRKYPKEVWIIDIIEDNIPENLLNEREVYWIAYYKTYPDQYNMTPGGTNSYFNKRTYQEWKDKNPEKAAYVIQSLRKGYSKKSLEDPNFIKRNIEVAQKGLREWQKNNPQRVKEIAQEASKKGAKKSSKKVYQLDKDTLAIINVYESMSAAARAFNKANMNSISVAVKNPNRTAYGFKWRLVEGGETNA